MSTRQTVTISGAAGAWGDSSLSTPQLLADGRSDYIVYEGLAEITMAILSRAMRADATLGYARDLIETIASNTAGYRERGIRVITNAGGVNAHAAASLIRVADPSVRVGVVTGDDLVGSRLLADAGLSGEPISVNAYLGARPIAAALDAGADVVVTGRVVDSALVLGPLVHEFGWTAFDHDLLAAGSLAGHLLECGPQSVGGLLTDWEDTTSWANPGYPIAEVQSNGSFVITAPEDSDALVDVRTVSEQLLYEIGDPSRYLLPDVVCDWTEVHLDQVGANRVRVSGARGLRPPSSLKACAQIPDGWRATSLLFIAGRDAVAKAHRVGADLIERGTRMLTEEGLDDFRATHCEVLGSETTYGTSGRREDTREVILKISVHHDNRDAVERFIREIPSIGLAGPPGVTGGGAGLPRPSPLIRLECFPLPRTEVQVRVEVEGEPVDYLEVDPDQTVDPMPSVRQETPVETHDQETVELPLIAVAHGRSGDKGPDVNIGIRVRDPVFWPLVLRELTVPRVAEHLSHLGATSVARYELPGIHAINFVLSGGLGAGGTASLRFDPQGKAVAQQLLDMAIEVPVELSNHPAVRM